jgi:hypothetical protein
MNMLNIPNELEEMTPLPEPAEKRNIVLPGIATAPNVPSVAAASTNADAEDDADEIGYSDDDMQQFAPLPGGSRYRKFIASPADAGAGAAAGAARGEGR